MKIDKEFFDLNGYLIINDLFSPIELDSLKMRKTKLVDEVNINNERTIFSTENGTQDSDKYFLDSSDKIHYFFEQDAFDNNGKLTVSKEDSINKIGHNLHNLDPVFHKFSYNERLLCILDQLGYKRPCIVQSMYIMKGAYKGGDVIPHQDSSFIQTQPYSCIGTWVGLEDATRNNGCMWVVPGSHNIGIKQMYNLSADGSAAKIDKPYKYNTEGAIPVEVKAGALVLLHGGVVHFSHSNTSSNSRNAYTLHIIEQEETEYLGTNWIRKPKGGFLDMREEIQKLKSQPMTNCTKLTKKETQI